MHSKIHIIHKYHSFLRLRRLLFVPTETRLYVPVDCTLWRRKKPEMTRKWGILVIGVTASGCGLLRENPAFVSLGKCRPCLFPPMTHLFLAIIAKLLPPPVVLALWLIMTAIRLMTRVSVSILKNFTYRNSSFLLF